MEFITTYVLPPILLGFLVWLLIIGFQNLKRRMSDGKSVQAPTRTSAPAVRKAAREHKRVCANGHGKADGQKICDECGQQ